jgi:hypothetical protein
MRETDINGVWGPWPQENLCVPGMALMLEVQVLCGPAERNR